MNPKIRLFIVFTVIFVYAAIQINCVSTDSSYMPESRNDGWPVSSPEKVGMDPLIFDRVYEKAERYDNIYSLLVVMDGAIIAEQYFNGMGVNDSFSIASVTKSYVSALTGIAIRDGFIPDVDAKMADYFPDISWGDLDPRKSEITLQHMLQMRSGYPWEEKDGYLQAVWNRRMNMIPLLAEFPLIRDPGTRYGYSNLGSHILGIIITRASGESLAAFARRTLLNPLGVSLTYWPQDNQGYYFGSGDMCFTPRDVARFGLLFLDKGMYAGRQLVPREWIDQSLTPYSFNIYREFHNVEILNNIKSLHYGYKWYTGTCGSHTCQFAWGQGGNLVFLVSDLNMVVVTTADASISDWLKTKVIMELVGEFIGSL